MATHCSEDSGILHPHFNFTGPPPLGYFDNLFTPSSSSPVRHNQPSNTVSSGILDLQKSDPEMFCEHIFGTADNESARDSLSMSNRSDLYVQSILDTFLSIVNDIFRSEYCSLPQSPCPSPPCPSPDFLTSLDTSRSQYNLPIATKLTINNDASLPMWKVWREPWIDLEPGIFVQGRFGQGVILELSHEDEHFHYFICYAFNDGLIFLIVPIKWPQQWWKKVLSKCRSLLPCVCS
jgi:hypothetical protein